MVGIQHPVDTDLPQQESDRPDIGSRILKFAPGPPLHVVRESVKIDNLEWLADTYPDEPETVLSWAASEMTNKSHFDDDDDGGFVVRPSISEAEGLRRARANVRETRLLRVLARTITSRYRQLRRPRRSTARVARTGRIAVRRRVVAARGSPGRPRPSDDPSPLPRAAALRNGVAA